MSRLITTTTLAATATRAPTSTFVAPTSTFVAPTSPDIVADDVRRIVREELRHELDRRELQRDYQALTRAWDAQHRRKP